MPYPTFGQIGSHLRHFAQVLGKHSHRYLGTEHHVGIASINHPNLDYAGYSLKYSTQISAVWVEFQSFATFILGNAVS